VDVKDGTKVKADATYIRESILFPQSKLVAGYDDIMPTFKGLVTEDGLLKLVEYVKSLGPDHGTGITATPGPTQTSTSPQPQTRAQGRTPAPAPAAGNR
jgi:hypothetical protein